MDWNEYKAAYFINKPHMLVPYLEVIISELDATGDKKEFIRTIREDFMAALTCVHGDDYE